MGRKKGVTKGRGKGRKIGHAQGHWHGVENFLETPGKTKKDRKTKTT